MKYSELNETLNSVSAIEKKAVINDRIQVENLTFLRLRDVLIASGRIIHEDVDNQVYIASIAGGLAKKNHAIVAFQLIDNEIVLAAYAKEGLINQHTSEGVINEFKGKISKYIQES